MTTTRAAAKRAAMDDPRNNHDGGEGSRGKRPALANISNDSNLPVSRERMSCQKAKAPGRTTSDSLPNGTSSSSPHGTQASTSPLYIDNAEIPKERNLLPTQHNETADGNITTTTSSAGNAPFPSPCLQMEASRNPHHGLRESQLSTEETLPPAQLVNDSQENNLVESSSMAHPPVNISDVLLDRILESSHHAHNTEAMASLERRTIRNLHINSSRAIRPGQVSSLRTADEHGSQEERQIWMCSFGHALIDNNHSDPQMCSAYATDIYSNLRLAELRRRPSTTFIENVQRDISSGMRGILVDWLVEVAEEYKLVPDTLYFTCAYIDRYLTENSVRRNHLQLLGVTCMLIASKYEEIYAPQIEEFCYITDNTYQREEVVSMERQVLNNLKFELSTPTTKSFLRRYIRAAQASLQNPSLQLEFLGNYLAELTLVEYSFLRFMPSMMAASAVFLAKLTLFPELSPWNSTLQHYTQYTASELKECVLALHALQIATGDGVLPAIREKYRQLRFQGVSSIPGPRGIDPALFLENYLA